MLIDTGPLVALFNPIDRRHDDCLTVARTIRTALVSTLPVLTEALHLLRRDRSGTGYDALLRTVAAQQLRIWSPDSDQVAGCAKLSAEERIGYADASLLLAAQATRADTIFTLDQRDFANRTVRRGHREYPLKLVP